MPGSGDDAAVPPVLRAVAAAALVVASVGTAPMQCAREPEPEMAHEEDPPEALYGLAEQFKERGDREARVTTLRYLVARFPSSRFAAMARQDLESLGAPVPDAGKP